MSDLTIFSQFVDDMPLRNITVKKFDQFVQMQSGQGLQPATINRRLSAIASFFAYVIVEFEGDTWRSPVHGQRHHIRMSEHLPCDVADNTFLPYWPW
ncbi:MAG: site-specific integrase [Anaerolineaceae bacterium]|nr:site-specific integrase [Anaerolineaceae bacterium]